MYHSANVRQPRSNTTGASVIFIVFISLPVFEFNSDGLQRGFTTVSPDASHCRAARYVFVQGKSLRRQNTEHVETQRHEGCLGVGSLRSLTDEHKALTHEPRITSHGPRIPNSRFRQFPCLDSLWSRIPRNRSDLFLGIHFHRFCSAIARLGVECYYIDALRRKMCRKA